MGGIWLYSIIGSIPIGAARKNHYTIVPAPIGIEPIMEYNRTGGESCDDIRGEMELRVRWRLCGPSRSTLCYQYTSSILSAQLQKA